MSWEIKIAKRVSKQVKRIPKKDAKRLSFILDELTKNPYQGDIEKIKGEENIWRRRIGSYRVLYEVFPNRKLISVFDIRRRRSRLTPYNHPLGGELYGVDILGMVRKAKIHRKTKETVPLYTFLFTY